MYQTLIKLATSAFPLWALAASLLALVHPAAFTWFNGVLITLGLGVVFAAENFPDPLARYPAPYRACSTP